MGIIGFYAKNSQLVVIECIGGIGTYSTATRGKIVGGEETVVIAAPSPVVVKQSVAVVAVAHKSMCSADAGTAIK